MDINYGQQIRMARYAREWSRDRLADEAGLHTDAIDAIENGHADPAPVLAALRLGYIELLLPAIGVSFLKTVVPIAQRIDVVRLPIALAAVMDVLGRAAAGEDVGRKDARIGQVVVCENCTINQGR